MSGPAGAADAVDTVDTVDPVGQARDGVAAAARRLAEAGLLVGTAGNVSARCTDAGEPLVAVTATGVRLGSCRPEGDPVVVEEGIAMVTAYLERYATPAGLAEVRP